MAKLTWVHLSDCYQSKVKYQGLCVQLVLQWSLQRNSDTFVELVHLHILPFHIEPIENRSAI